MSRATRILYAAGPGDVIGTFGYWKQGRDDPNQVARTYSGQFFDVVKKRDLVAYVITSNKKRGIVRDGNITIEHRPQPLTGFGGPIYHLGQLWYMLRIIVTAIRFGADVIVYADGTTQWWSLGLARWFGIAAVPSLHCTLWPSGAKPGGLIHRMIQKLDGRFWRQRASASIAISPECQRQAEEVAGGASQVKGPFHQARPSYPREYFSSLASPLIGAPVFRVMYAGRVERNKGVFELLEAASRLEKESPGKYLWDICGGGGALEELRSETTRRGMQNVFLLHGMLQREQMAENYSRSHVIVVPTTSAFSEGLNKVAVEGVLANRPVIVSKTVPALELLHSAAVAIDADDVNQIVDAVRKLATDETFYRQKQSACAAIQAPFFDPACSFASCIERVVDLAQH